MREDRLAPLVAEAVEQHRPGDVPPFETLTARWRRRRRVRRGAVAAAVVVAAAAAPAALPAAFSTPEKEPEPQVGASGQPVGRVPPGVTGVRACRAADCRTVTDPAQVRLLVDGLNANEPYPFDDRGPCRADPVGVTLTFSGAGGPYPVVEVMPACGWWVVTGESERNALPPRDRDDVLQAQKFGVVVHDCGVTDPSFGPDVFAPRYVGLTLDEAVPRAEAGGVAVRVLGEDDDCADAVTFDLKGNRRVNLYLENGRVKTASYF